MYEKRTAIIQFSILRLITRCALWSEKYGSKYMVWQMRCMYAGTFAHYILVDIFGIQVQQVWILIYLKHA